MFCYNPVIKLLRSILGFNCFSLKHHIEHDIGRNGFFAALRMTTLNGNATLWGLCCFHLLFLRGDSGLDLCNHLLQHGLGILSRFGVDDMDLPVGRRIEALLAAQKQQRHGIGIVFPVPCRFAVIGFGICGFAGHRVQGPGGAEGSVQLPPLLFRELFVGDEFFHGVSFLHLRMIAFSFGFYYNISVNMALLSDYFIRSHSKLMTKCVKNP